MITSNEIYDRFIDEVDCECYGIKDTTREDFLIFPDNHPTTWIIAFKGKNGFVVIAFYPREDHNHEFNDWEEFDMSPQNFMEHFGYDTCADYFAKKEIKWEAWL